MARRPTNARNYNHNLDFLASAAMMAGQYAEARKAADQLVANATPALAQMPMLEPFAAKTLFVLLRFARWDDVLKLPAADARFPLLTALSHFGRGIAHAARGNATEADRERAAYAEARKAIKPDSDWGFNKANSMLEGLRLYVVSGFSRTCGARERSNTPAPHRPPRRLQSAPRPRT